MDVADDVACLVLIVSASFFLACVVYSLARVNWVTKHRLAYIDKLHQETQARNKVRADFHNHVEALRAPIVPRPEETAQMYNDRLTTCIALWDFLTAVGWPDVPSYSELLKQHYVSFDEMCDKYFWVWDFEKLRKKQ